MTETFTRPARSLKQALDRQLPKRRDESGLTTLEWLLIVAAVAGLAALAVVLVTNVVSDTSEDICRPERPQTAAELAPRIRSKGPSTTTRLEFDSRGQWDVYFTNSGNRIVIHGSAMPLTTVRR